MSTLQNEKVSSQQSQFGEGEQSEGGGQTAHAPALQLKASGGSTNNKPIQRKADPLSKTVTEDAMDHLALREGFRNKVYKDSLGYPTVGTGHLLTPSQRQQYPVGSTVPNNVLRQWLKEDSTKAYNAAYQQIRQIKSDHQPLLDALTAVNFQLGTAWNKTFKGTWSKLLANQWEAAALGCADSLWFKQTPVRVIDFQRVLLQMAGKPTDYDSMKKFNAGNIRKRGAVWPSKDNFNAFHLGSAPKNGGGGSGGGNTGGGKTGGGNSGGGSSGGGGGLDGPVGVDSKGRYVGSSSDIRMVQQYLINAGMLSATYVSKSGKKVSNVDGKLGSNTISAIRKFQSKKVGMKDPDGRIDPGGGTWKKLVTYKTAPKTGGGGSAGGGGGSTPQISGPVGLDAQGKNVGSKADVKTVQQLLINKGFLPATTKNSKGQKVSNADGVLGPKTIAAIKSFQSKVLRFSQPDGRVDPGGRTWKALNGQTTQEPVKEQPKPTPGNGNGGGNSGGGSSGGGNSEVGSPQTGNGDLTAFDQIPKAFRDRHAIGGGVGNGGRNSAGDVSKVSMLLRMAGYRTELLSATGSAAQQREKKRIQLANCIYNFQMCHGGLGVDARVDPNGGTWKKLVQVAYKNGHGNEMSDSALTKLNNSRKGSKKDVPSDIIANITDGHLLGIDNSGYLLPKELHGHARKLKGALDKIRGEIGNFSISCGYRSPEHNVKIGSTATMSQHTGGYAADIQWSRPTALKNHIIGMIRAGKIPPGGVGTYSWGVHYDTRGTLTTWNG